MGYRYNLRKYKIACPAKPRARVAVPRHVSESGQIGRHEVDGDERSFNPLRPDRRRQQPRLLLARAPARSQQQTHPDSGARRLPAQGKLRTGIRARFSCTAATRRTRPGTPPGTKPSSRACIAASAATPRSTARHCCGYASGISARWCVPTATLPPAAGHPAGGARLPADPHQPPHPLRRLRRLPVPAGRQGRCPSRVHRPDAARARPTTWRPTTDCGLS